MCDGEGAGSRGLPSELCRSILLSRAGVTGVCGWELDPLELELLVFVGWQLAQVLARAASVFKTIKSSFLGGFLFVFHVDPRITQFFGYSWDR